MKPIRFLHPPRTGGTSIVKAWGLEAPEYRGHELPSLIEMLADGPRGTRTVYVVTIRNPWDRMVSLYHHGRRGRLIDDVLFRAWLLNPLTAEREYGNRFRALLSRPCAHWRVEGVQIIRFENREYQLRLLAEELGRPVPELHENRSPRRGHYSRYYDSETRELVAAWFHEDIERFGYTFEEIHP